MVEQQTAKRTQQQRSFIEQWCDERGIDPMVAVLQSTSQNVLGVPGFTFVNHDANGAPRIDLSTRRYDRDENKYISPKGKGSIVYAPRPESLREWEAAEDVWLAEGEGKCLALLQLGLPTLCVRGCNSWHLKGSKDLHPILAERVQPGKRINIVFDADWQANPRVKRGLHDCMAAIRALGGVPCAVNIPNIPGRTDTGIDDLIALWRAEGSDNEDVLSRLDTLPKISNLDDHDRRLVPIDEVMRRPPPRWAIHGVILTGDVTTIVGPTSCGKSFLVMDLLLALSTGREHWFGQNVRSHGLTVHVSLEGRGMPSRAKAYCERYDLTSIPNHFVYEQPITLSDSDQTAELIGLLKELSAKQGLPIAGVAVDTVNRTMDGNENDAEAMRNFTSEVERIQRAFPDAAIIAVHHTGKDPSRGARGSSVLSANFGGELQIRPDEKTGIKEIWIQKVRDGQAQYTFGHFVLDVMELGRDRYEDAITSCVVVPAAPPLQPTKEVYPALFKIWVERGREPVPKSWFWSTAIRATLRDEYEIRISRSQMEQYFSETLIVENGLLIDQGPGAGGGVHYLLSEARILKY